MANLVPKNDGTFSFLTKLGEFLLEKKNQKIFCTTKAWRVLMLEELVLGESKIPLKMQYAIQKSLV